METCKRLRLKKIQKDHELLFSTDTTVNGGFITMKQLMKISRIEAYLEKILRALNNEYFEGCLNVPCISVVPREKRRISGFEKNAWDFDGEYMGELTIGYKQLAEPIEVVVALLLHEMVHIYNQQNNVRDSSRNGTYHNLFFQEAAMEHGLLVERDEIYGFSVTSASEGLIDFIVANGWQDIPLARVSNEQEEAS